MRKVTPVFTAAVAAVLIAAAAPQASAHARLVKANPPPRATLHVSPERIRLEFSERMEAAYCRVVLLGPDGRQLQTGQPASDPADQKILVFRVPPLVPGEHTVRFRVVSVDGHIVESSYRFTIERAPPRK